MVGFVIGQRWISASEPELGLGIVSAVAVNRVTILYLACDESRIYAQDNAPLTRVRFSVDDEIETQDGQQGLIQKIKEHNGVVRYQFLNQQGEQGGGDEMDLSHHIYTKVGCQVTCMNVHLNYKNRIDDFY